jgi:hypothetical protein
MRKKTLIVCGLAVLVVAVTLLALPTEKAVAGTMDIDGDGRSITFTWSGADLTVTGNSVVIGDAYVDVEVQADIGQGYEFFGGGASASYGGAFNPTTNKTCLSTHGLGTGTSVQVVVTYFDSLGSITDTETFPLNIP